MQLQTLAHGVNPGDTFCGFVFDDELVFERNDEGLDVDWEATNKNGVTTEDGSLRDVRLNVFSIPSKGEVAVGVEEVDDTEDLEMFRTIDGVRLLDCKSERDVTVAVEKVLNRVVFKR